MSDILIKNFRGEETPPSRKKPWKAVLFFLGVFAVFFITLLLFIVSPPNDFPVKTVITVNKGESLSELSENLKKENIIRSTFLLNNFIIWLEREKQVVAGDYYFSEPLSVFEIAQRITTGRFDLVPLKVTFPEGLNLFEIGEVARMHLVQFDPVEFLEKTREKEGYLFPDTYSFLSNAKASDVILVMEENFEEKMKPLLEEIFESGRTKEEIITMASLIEEEARDGEARKIISGILWKRIKLGMPLQVDSAFQYVNGKNTYELTADDLKLDSPYNTYKYAGLPPTPISNPGMDSILAALRPVETSYLYFLSDRKGNMYYAKTFEEHVVNKQRYLNRN